MIKPTNTEINQNPIQISEHYFEQAPYFEQLKRSSMDQPHLFHYYAEQQYYNKSLAHQYYRMSVDDNRSEYRNNNNSTPSLRINETLLNSLQAGGYILYARHAEANVGVDQPNLNFQDCRTQRNLSERGRQEAASYGEALRRLNIPIMIPVESSPLCRTIETASLAFGHANIQVNPFWFDIYRLSSPLSPDEYSRILNQLYMILETPPPQGSNKVIIAHSFPRGVGLDTIPNMGTVVVRPRGQGNGFDVVGHIPLRD